MKYFNTKHEKDSARITTVITVILILLIFIVGPTYDDPPKEYGVAVNFGNSPVGSGNIQPKRPVQSPPKQINKPPQETKVKKTEPKTSKAEEVKEKVLTQESEEAIAIKKQKEAEAKAKAEEEARKRAEEARIAEEKRKREEKKKELDALIGGIGKTDGNNPGSEGNDSEPGDKGQLNGNPYAPSYFGEPGSGNGGVGYGLRGRGRPTNSKVLPECNEEGRVVVKITVNRSGKVTSAEAGGRGTTGALCLYDAAKKTALTYKWPADSKAPAKQIGFVVINFSVGQ